MNSNEEIIEYDDDILKHNLMFINRINNIVDWFKKFNDFIIKTHTTPAKEIENIKVVNKPPIEISLKILSKFDIGKFSATDEHGEKVLDMLIRYQKYLALQLNNYLNIRPDIQRLLDTTWYRENVLVEFNNYLLLLIKLGEVYKSALVNVKKREKIQEHVDKFGIKPSIQTKFDKLVSDHNTFNLKLNLLEIHFFF